MKQLIIDNFILIYLIGAFLNVIYLGFYKKIEGDPLSVLFMWFLLWPLGMAIRLTAKAINVLKEYYRK